ncbi:hypothetical protein B0181_10535 [Moraxella caviae]|uniref:Uncharacterized protein n=1 Tax=Moraxella caviae TaxID=34060 RepID=A0A1S9ZUU4_9GAMM|nr:hypothetical protein B0181_10535 [Moraxella caviae]
MGLDVPDEPPTDYIINALLNIFYLAARSRRYVGGMGAVALPLTVKDISDVLFAHPVYLSRTVIDSVIFALDNLWLEQNRR